MPKARSGGPRFQERVVQDISEALEVIDMEWLLQREGITYKESYGRSGRQLNARTCPFRHTSEYKVYINAETGVGNCFSGNCPKKTWNKWSLLKGIFELEGRQLSTLIRELAREQGWRPKLKTAELTLQDLNTLDLPESTPAWQMTPLPEYLARRGVDAELAEHFSLHWSESGVWSYMDPRGFQGSQDYSNRILIPIFDLNGEMVSFQGRDTTGEAEQRYLFPPGFASAGAYLYNGVNVAEGTETVVISEGVFDVIQTKRALSQNTLTKHMVPIGTFGMHLSSGNPTGDDQLGRLRQLKRERGVKRVIFLWDGELKAVAAATHAALECVKVGLQADIAFVPDGRDPGNTYPHLIQAAVMNPMPCRTKLDALKVIRHSQSIYTTA